MTTISLPAMGMSSGASFWRRMRDIEMMGKSRECKSGADQSRSDEPRRIVIAWRDEGSDWVERRQNETRTREANVSRTRKANETAKKIGKRQFDEFKDIDQPGSLDLQTTPSPPSIDP
ncbi:hypothetical protein C8J56DRAFT_896172 [Mycena floridula]|nr:hypothetical protein C8J56DRAFT_896172 [Mycena floridula]